MPPLCYGRHRGCDGEAWWELINWLEFLSTGFPSFGESVFESQCLSVHPALDPDSLFCLLRQVRELMAWKGQCLGDGSRYRVVLLGRIIVNRSP